MSGFIEEINSKLLYFDWAKPIGYNGSTCECYVVQIDGKRFFMKRLRQEHINDQAYRALFRKEYEKGISMFHPNLVRYEKLIDSDNDCYILMENIAGETFDNFIKSHPDYFNARVHLDKFFNQLLSALKCMHEHHVIYSDLKPQNIMLTQVNNDVKIVDLGFCFTDSYPDSAGTTSGFSAPEHLNRSKLNISTDVYGIGKIIEYIGKNLTKTLPPIYTIIMAKCLKEQQVDRWQNIDEILTLLNKRSKPWLKWLTFIMVVVTSLVGYVIWQKSSETTPISNDIVSVNYIYYSNFNNSDMTCEAIGEDSLKHPNIYIRKSIDYKGKEYDVISIANSAFKSHNHLKTVHIAEGIKRIGNEAFFYCDSLLVINTPNSVTEIGDHAFYGCKGVTEIILSKNLKEISTACFVATKISRLNIPEGVEVIRLDAFAHCSYIKEIKLPSTVKHLERGVFYNCLSLKKIELPAGLERIDEYLFFGCNSLKDIYIHAVMPPQTLELHRNPAQITLHVPAESVDAYRNAPYWQDMNIVAIK